MPDDPKERWREQAESLLPPSERVAQRNAAITATYATLYLEHRELFKWAGMAAFASFQVGLALAPLGDGVRLGELGSDLDLVRETNNAVFADIAWAHLAYRDAGIEEVRRCLETTQQDRLLLSGFEQIDAARRGVHVDAARVWRANALLLEHEQHHTVQPRFERFNELFGIALSCATMLDFDADHSRLDRKTISAFTLFMLTRGALLLLLTRSLPNVVRFDQRWFWIQRSLFPKWKAVDARDPNLNHKMRLLARGRLPG